MKGCGDGRNYLCNQSIQVQETGGDNAEVLLADVIDCLIINLITICISLRNYTTEENTYHEQTHSKNEDSLRTGPLAFTITSLTVHSTSPHKTFSVSCSFTCSYSLTSPVPPAPSQAPSAPQSSPSATPIPSSSLPPLSHPPRQSCNSLIPRAVTGKSLTTACNFLINGDSGVPFVTINNSCLAELSSAEIGNPGCTAFRNSFSCCAMLLIILFPKLLLAWSPAALGTEITVMWASSSRA